MKEKKPILKEDVVNHPSHYNQGNIETIDHIEDIIKDYKCPIKGYLAGNVIKYLHRAPYKGEEKENLQKANWYMNRLASK